MQTSSMLLSNLPNGVAFLEEFSDPVQTVYRAVESIPVDDGLFCGVFFDPDVQPVHNGVDFLEDLRF